MEHFTEEMAGHWYGDVTHRAYEIVRKGSRYTIYHNGLYVDYAETFAAAAEYCVYCVKTFGV